MKEIIRKRSLNINVDKWRHNVCDSVFYFFSVFGLFIYIPGSYYAIIEGKWSILLTNSGVYLICIYLTFSKKISYRFKSLAGTLLFYFLGLFLQLRLGTGGAGDFWLFSSTILATMLLGHTGAVVTFIINIITQIVILFIVSKHGLTWYIPPRILFIRSGNFALLNFVIIIVNHFYMKRFNNILIDLTQTRDATIIGLAQLAEHRDHNTGKHLQRLQNYVIILGNELKKHIKYKEYITDDYLKDLYISSLLHDIGKVGIGDSILLKEDALTEEEFKIIKEHPRIGYDVIKKIENNIDGVSLFSLGREIALNHHEKWDGNGYPDGKIGEDIPLSARIVAIVDVYDAVTSERPYKKAFTHEEAIEIIKDGSGSHFDPEIVDAFLSISEELKSI